MSVSSFFRVLAGFSLLVLLAFTSCDDPVVVEDSGVFELNFTVRAGGAPYVPGSVFSSLLKQRYHVDTFKLYISDLRLVRADGIEEKLADTELFDFVEDYSAKTAHGAGVYRQYQVAPGAYKGIRFGLGVAPAFNSTNPGQYSANHPLGSAQKMYLGDGNGYAFLKLTGSLDSTAAQTGSVNYPFSYYTALDALYQPFDYTLDKHNFSIESNAELIFGFELDINRLFYNSTDTINMVAQPITTGTPTGSADFELSRKITQNFASNAIYKLPF